MPRDAPEEVGKEPEGREVSKKAIWGVGIAILLLGLFVVAGTSVKVPYQAKVIETVKEPYDATETYTEREPYTVQECEDVQVPYSDKECHTEKEPYTDEVCDVRDYSYTIMNHRVTKELEGFNYMCYGRFDVRNNENQAGVFSFSYVFHSGTLGDQPRSAKSKNIYALGTETWVFSYDCDAGESVSGSYSAVSIPTITECHTETKYRDKEVCVDVVKYRTERQCEDVIKYRDVQKTRTVTKYRDVDKEREVTKYHSLFDEWGVTAMVARVMGKD